MNLKQLRYFIEVAEQRSFTRASGNLYVCQSALSKMIKVLEQDLGVQLIDRSTKHFQLTSEGEVLYEHGRDLLKRTSAELEELIDSVHKEKGRLSIGIPPVIGTAYFPRIIQAFRELYPDIELQIYEEGANTVKNKVEEGKIDIGIVMMPFYAEGFHVTPIFTSENIIVVHKDHPLANRTSVYLKELQNDRFILLDSSYMLHDQILMKCKEAGFQPDVLCESSQWDFIAEMVSMNQGVTILPAPILKRFKSEDIRILAIEEPQFPWNVGMIRMKDKYCSHPIQLFLDWMMTQRKV